MNFLPNVNFVTCLDLTENPSPVSSSRQKKITSIFSSNLMPKKVLKKKHTSGMSPRRLVSKYTTTYAVSTTKDYQSTELTSKHNKTNHILPPPKKKTNKKPTTLFFSVIFLKFLKPETKHA